MKSEVARLFVYQFNVSLFWNAIFLTSNFIFLHYTDLRLQRILVSKHNSLWSNYRIQGHFWRYVLESGSSVCSADLLNESKETWVWAFATNINILHCYIWAILPTTSWNTVVQETTASSPTSHRRWWNGHSGNKQDSFLSFQCELEFSYYYEAEDSNWRTDPRLWGLVFGETSWWQNNLLPVEFWAVPVSVVILPS